MAGVFDFADLSRVAVEVAPDMGAPIEMNGWQYTARPNVPYRRRFTVTLTGMRWYMGNGVLDVTTNSKYNAGRLLAFYRQNQMWDTFSYQHEYLGNISCQFASPVNVPKAIPSSNGRIESFDINLIHYNPSF